MKDKIQTKFIPSEYMPPECIIVHLGKADVVATSGIYLPMQPLGDDPYNVDDDLLR